MLSPGFRRALQKRGVPADKVLTIYNWADEIALESRESLKPEQSPFDSDFNVLFAGNIGIAQGLETILEAGRY